ncbi:MAG TPA: hypothetical protein VFF88_09060 [Methylocella sp.]|nr:hypothetical protein [Methylocella sp.]
MPENETPEVTMVPVKRYDVNLTLDDILTPLLDAASRLDPAMPQDEVQQLEPHLRRLSELARELKDVAAHINRINPAVLSPQGKRGPAAD